MAPGPRARAADSFSIARSDRARSRMIRASARVLWVLAALGCAGAADPPALPAPPSPVPSPPPAGSRWWPAAFPSDPWYPSAAAILPDGAVAVAETHQNRLYLLRGFEEPPERLASPDRRPTEWTALAVAPGLSFYALDGPGHRIQQYDLHGNYLGLALDLDRVAEAQNLGPVDPAGLAVDRAGQAVVTDRLGDRLLVFGPGWSYLGSWGQTGSEPGAWRRPGAVAVGDRPPFLVADEGNQRVVLVDGLGRATAAASLSEPPRGVAVAGDGAYLVSFADTVRAYGPGLAPGEDFLLPRGPGCDRRPFATTALAAHGRAVWAGDGCSGRLLETARARP